MVCKMKLPYFAIAAALMFLSSACETPYRPVPYVAKPRTAPVQLICHDAVGHVRGSRPWVLGGTCCCTPTRANYELHRSDGTIDAALSYDEYLGLYRDRGITTDLDHRACGNLCANGPHVVLGGKCMSTPVPGTAFYERVTYGPHEPAGWSAEPP